MVGSRRELERKQGVGSQRLVWKLLDEKFSMQEFSVGALEGDQDQQIAVAQESIAPSQDVNRLVRAYASDPRSLARMEGLSEHVRARLPFIFLGHSARSAGRIFGDFYNTEGIECLLDAEVNITTAPRVVPPALAEISEIMRGLRARKFACDERVACLRGLEYKENRWVLTVAPGNYSDFYLTNGACNTRLTVQDHCDNPNTDMLQRLQEWRQANGGVDAPSTFGEAVIRLHGELPDFSAGVYSNTIGVATVLISGDGHFIFADRNPKFVGVNPGINCPASGGVSWNQNQLQKMGVVGATLSTLGEESRAELGLKLRDVVGSAIHHQLGRLLGTELGDYDASFVGAARELKRGGSPEFFFAAYTHLSVVDIIKRIQANTNREKLEAASILSQPVGEAYRMIKAGGADVFHDKLLMNLMFAQKYLLEQGVRF